MLSPYVRAQRMIDSLSLVQNRLNLKVNIADTASMLTSYLKSSVANVHTQLKATYVTTETDPVVKAINGGVKSNGTTISAAIPGTDYITPTGNAATATKLAATKNINGVAFDGSADITVPAAATTLTGTSLKLTIVASSLPLYERLLI